MKQIYFLTTILFLTFISLNAQTVTITGSCDSEDTDGDFNLSENINGRPSYVHSNNLLMIRWSGARWEAVVISDTSIIGMYNNANTANPPASSFSPWTAQECDPTGTFSGDGTSSSTLGINDVELVTVDIKSYPNPAIDYLFISGLEKEIKFKIYNTLGAKVQKGRTSNDEKIDIQNLHNGLYFLKFDNGNTLKFIKK
jgi:hypothetical protein